MPQCCSGNDLVLFASAAAIAIAKDMDPSDINILGSFFNALGDNLGVIAAQREACK